MKGHVHQRGSTWTYVIDMPQDPLTGKRRQVTKGGWATKKEAWTECREAIKKIESGRHVTPSRRKLGEFLVDEWLPAIKSTIKATTWANWNIYARSYVVPILGEAILQRLTAPQLQAFYGHLLASGRVKADLGRVMFDVWLRGREDGKEPTARQVAQATGASILRDRLAGLRDQPDRALMEVSVEPATRLGHRPLLKVANETRRNDVTQASG